MPLLVQSYNNMSAKQSDSRQVKLNLDSYISSNDPKAEFPRQTRSIDSQSSNTIGGTYLKNESMLSTQAMPSDLRELLQESNITPKISKLETNENKTQNLDIMLFQKNRSPVASDELTENFQLQKRAPIKTENFTMQIKSKFMKTKIILPQNKRFHVAKTHLSNRNNQSKISCPNESLNYVSMEDDRISNMKLESEAQVDSICIKKCKMPCIKKPLNSNEYTNQNNHRFVIYRSTDLSKGKNSTRR